MIRINSLPDPAGGSTGYDPFLAALTSDEPLARRMLVARAQPDPRDSHLGCAVLAAFLGDAQEAEVALIRASGERFGQLDPLIDAAWAFVLVETGHAARAMIHLDRAREAIRPSDIPSHASLLLLLRAQALFARRGLKEARAVAAEARDSLPDGKKGTLRSYASIVCGNLALEDGDLDAVESELALAGNCSGILAARIDVLRARLCFARTGDARSAALDLDKAINRLAVMGALRDLALAYFERALQAGLDPAGSPGRWLARAQSLLAGAGGPASLQTLRRPWASLERRLLHRANRPAIAMVGDLRQQGKALQRAVKTRCVSCREGRPCQVHEEMQGALATVSKAEEHLSAALEHSITETSRVGELAAATHELASFDDYDELVEALPRLALVVCPGTGAQVVRLRDDGSLETIATSGAAPAGSGPAIAKRVREAFSTRAPREHAKNEPIAAARVGAPEERLAVVVARDAPGASIGERDLEQLALYASFATSSLLRTRSRASLRETAARDAATLAVIPDGVIAVDPTGRVRSLNQIAAAALGVQRGEAIGRKLGDIPGLAALAAALAPSLSAARTVSLPHGEMVVRAHPYEGGTIAVLRDVASEHIAAKRLVGSMARFTFDRLVGEDPAFLELLATARQAATSDLPILITGESGTGKELLAQAIHNASGRTAAPFVGVNVTAIPRELVESELFGYEGGTFTGARASGRPGKFELAGRGTLLLDEIGDMPTELQGKLLRVLQEKVVQRLGSVSDVPVRARVIATTHRDLEEAVALGSFRLDLYHRIRVVHLQIPSLRARKGDILRLAQHQLRTYAEQTRRGPITLSPAVASAFEAYDWPGNIRELCNVVESEVSLLPAGDNVISRIPHALQQAATPRPAVRSAPSDTILSLDELESRACAEALDRCAGNVTRAAQALGVAKNTLYAKMRKYGLIAPDAGRARASPRKYR